MRTLTLALLLAASLAAADAPKPDQPPIPVEQKLAIREAQLQTVRISDALSRMALQYQALEAKQKEAQEALDKLVGALKKPADCKDCELSDAELKWFRPKTEPAKETK